MDKNTLIGIVLMGLLLFGFTFYQNKQYQKQAAYQAQLDSIAAVEQFRADSIAAVEAAALRQASSQDSTLLADGSVSVLSQQAVYKDSLLEAAHNGEAQIITLSNDKFEVAFTTKGAQPWSARLKDYKTYGGEDLYLFKPESSLLALQVYAGEMVNTSEFNFNVAEKTDTSVVMRLPFAGGGYIEQKYSIREGEYIVDNALSFVGMENIIPKNVFNLDIDYSMTIPRMEKGYKNESQYSKLNYYFSGEKKPSDLGRSRSSSKRVDNKIAWFAFQQQFFSAIFRAPNEYTSADFDIKFFPEDDESHNLMTCQAKVRTDFQPGQHETVVPFQFYFGPNHYKTLKSYDQKFERMIPLGGSVVGIFTKYVIIPTFDLLRKSISNFGIIILIMTILIKLVVLPFAYKSYSSSAKMQAIKPEIDKLNAKYPKQEDAMKKQQAQMDLYKRAGISPMGGCLPMLLQFPILWAMFRFFPASIELRQQPFLWADDLSAYDSFINFGTRIPLLGDHISLFALLMAISMFFYSKLTTASQPGSDDPQMASMRFMSVWMMPIMMYFICNSLSSGLSYYYLLSNLITMLETWVIKKWFVHPEEIQARLKATEGKKAPKSKWQQRLEEAQRMQAQMQKEQAKKNGKR
ncbi:MAG: membrane protein insertase YidC [Bacteroidales bacterium]|nr:membrane protein insertase YidC [Bacteroidales bacterium]MBQ5978621.1 membrane protein insertase YidC [Bacteroidales bacterium]